MTRVVLAMMKHETNTFSPVPTDLARFSKGAERPLAGAEILAAYRGTGSCTAGFIDEAEAAGAEIVPSIAANAPPSGPVHTAAYEYICDAILESVAGGCDAILLDLHGAMVTERHEDGEGELLARIRAIAPDVPIGVTLDMHANLYPAMVEHADVIAGYQTYPHIDYRETGVRAARPIFAMLRGEVRPVAAWGNRPMLPHVMRQGSGDFPNRELQARAQEMEADGAIVASLFTGFPHADIANAGLGCVVVTDGDRAAAERMRDELLDFAWSNREAFVYRIEPLADSIARARGAAADTGDPPARHPSAHGDGPVVLLDHYDNAASGGTMDSMTVLRAILDAELEDVAVFAIHDPGAVRELIAAGVGAETTVMLGGKIDMPAIRMAGEPLESHRPGQAHRGRTLPQPRARLDRRRDEHGPDGGARHRARRDRGHLPAPRAERPQLLLEPRDRPAGAALPHAEEPRSLPGRLLGRRPRHHRVRRHRGVHLRLRHARLPQRPPAHLPLDRIDPDLRSPAPPGASRHDMH